MTSPVYQNSASAPGRLRRVRLAVGYGAIASALPYLALKVVWLAGGDLGVAEPMTRESSMVALNVLTAGMDLVAVAIALAFTHDWGPLVRGNANEMVVVNLASLVRLVAGLVIGLVMLFVLAGSTRRNPARTI